jgi:ribosomal protein S15P/S13E
MRHPYAEASMAVIISDIDNLQEFIQNHRKDLYILLTGSRLTQLVDNEKIKEVTDRNLSWRKDLT